MNEWMRIAVLNAAVLRIHRSLPPSGSRVCRGRIDHMVGLRRRVAIVTTTIIIIGIVGSAS